jgi:hypothetical protein
MLLLEDRYLTGLTRARNQNDPRLGNDGDEAETNFQDEISGNIV